MFRRERLVPFGAAALGLLFLSQALRLDYESAFGPGPGVFPQIVTGMAVALAVALLLVPALSREVEATPGEAEEALAPPERRTFRLYVASLVLLVVGSAWLGFVVTALLVALLLTWFAERRPLHHALLFGLACGAVGTIGLGFAMQIEVPYGAIDSLLLRPFR